MMFICGLTTLTKAVNHTFKVDDGIWAHMTDHLMTFSEKEDGTGTMKLPSIDSDQECFWMIYYTQDRLKNTKKNYFIRSYKDSKNNYYIAFFWKCTVVVTNTYGVKIWKLNYLDGKKWPKWICCMDQPIGFWECTPQLDSFDVISGNGEDPYVFLKSVTYGGGSIGWTLKDNFKEVEGVWVHERTQNDYAFQLDKANKMYAHVSNQEITFDHNTKEPKDNHILPTLSDDFPFSGDRYVKPIRYFKDRNNNYFIAVCCTNKELSQHNIVKIWRLPFDNKKGKWGKKWELCLSEKIEPIILLVDFFEAIDDKDGLPHFRLNGVAQYGGTWEWDWKEGGVYYNFKGNDKSKGFTVSRTVDKHKTAIKL